MTRDEWIIESMRHLDKNVYEERAREKKESTLSLIKVAIWIGLICLVAWSIIGCGCAYAMDASYYSESALKRDGQDKITHMRMANSEVFSDDQYIGASRDYPLGTVVRITAGEHSTVVVIKDRINKRFKDKRIDLSPRAFKEIAGPLGLGRGIVPNVTVEVL